jgi:hypothetical protein
MDEIRIKVTRERYEEVISIDDDMNFLELTNIEAYNYMTQFCLNGDDNSYLSQQDARKLFKQIPRKEFTKYVTEFIKSVGDAFVNPPSERESGEQ